MPKVKPMTAAEQMVWAAVFAKEYDIHNPPSSAIADDDKWKEWELSQLTSAAECAGGAVSALRGAQEAIREGWDGFDVADFAAQMVKR